MSGPQPRSTSAWAGEGGGAMLTQTYWPAVGRAVRQWRVALLLVQANLAEIRRTSRIALLNPFISVLVLAVALGYVYSGLIGVPLREHLPYLAVGLALWQGISGLLLVSATYNDTTHRHLGFSNLSVYLFPLAGLIEALLQTLARLAAALLVVIVAKADLQPLLGIAPALLGFGALAALLFFLSTVTAFLLDRFPLLNALTPQVLFVAFLLTPILWLPEQLAGARWLVDLNPLHHALEVVRAPVLTGRVPWPSLAIVLGLAAAMAGASGLLHTVNRRLIAFPRVA